MSHGEICTVLGLREPFDGLHTAAEQTLLPRGDELPLRMSIELDVFTNAVCREGLGKRPNGQALLSK